MESPNKIIFLDIETTGFSRQWNEIIEIAALEVDAATGNILSTFHRYIKPRGKLNSTIIELTHITPEMLANEESESVVLMDFIEWFMMAKPDCIVGHNCKAFDLPFIQERCGKFGLNWSYNKYTIIDTLAIARALNKNGTIKTENCKQPTLAQYYGITYEAHSAIEDVKALVQLYYKMCQDDEEDVGF